MLKLNQLRAFNELMLVGSISEAARNLHRTQSSISATIAGIEESLGMELFERRGGRLHPKQEAKYLHEEASEILRRMETLSGNMQRIKSLETGQLNIACMPGPSIYFMPNLVAEFSRNNPGVRSVISARSSEGVYRQMSAQQCDIGLADFIPERSEEAALIDTKVYELPCQCLLPSSHPLARKDRLSPTDLSGIPLATLGEDHAIHEQIARNFAQCGATANFTFMTQYFLSLFTYVEKGLACGIVDPISGKHYVSMSTKEQGLVFRPLEPVIYFSVACITPKHRPKSKLSEEFGKRLTEVLELHSM